MKRIAQNLLLLLASVTFSALLLEQGFRCWLFGWQAFDRESLRNNAPINNAGFMIQSPFDDIYWALKPDLDTSFKMAHLTTNSYGLADKEYPREKPNNSYRIAVLGDSYSMASGVDTDKSFHALLEEWMNNADHSPYEMINFAVGGFGLERYNATLQHIVPAWQPDAILLGFCGFNDQQAFPPRSGPVPTFNPRRLDGFWTSYVYQYIEMFFKEKSDLENRANTALTEKNLAFIDKELGLMRQLANQIKPDLPILLAYLDNREHSEQDLANLEIIAQKHNMQFIDTSRQFKGLDLADHSLHILDSHPNTKAHAMFATTLWQKIQQMHLFGVSGVNSQ